VPVFNPVSRTVEVFDSANIAVREEKCEESVPYSTYAFPFRVAVAEIKTAPVSIKRMSFITAGVVARAFSLENNARRVENKRARRERIHLAI
jgi:hypothetical protein